MISPDTNVVLLGASGSGKGTQAEKLSQEFGWKHLEMGQILRELSKEDSPLGKKVNHKVSSGEWVQDELVNEIIEAEIKKVSKGIGIIFDGFPRTSAQAKFLKKILIQEKRKLPIVINLWVRSEKLVYRLLNRRICDKCSQLYYPPKSLNQKSCSCGGKLVRRDDDTEEIIKKRISEYEEKTEKLTDFYRKEGRLIKVNGEPDIKQVWDSLRDALSKSGI